jgi:hypothetical protein
VRWQEAAQLLHYHRRFPADHPIALGCADEVLVFAASAIVRATPTGIYARRIWFLYEWLLGKTLDLPTAEKGVYANVVDSDLQWTAGGTTSSAAVPGPGFGRSPCSAAL